MKKSILFTLLAIFFMACEGPEGPMGPMGPNGKNGRDGQNGLNGKDGKDGTGGANWYTTSFTIKDTEWILSGAPGDLNTYFYVHKPLSQLTSDIYQYGTVIAYLETQKGVKNGMPYVLHQGEAADSKEFLWTQTYDFDFVTGEVGFYVTYSDFNTQIRPGTETFHIVLMW